MNTPCSRQAAGLCFPYLESGARSKGRAPYLTAQKTTPWAGEMAQKITCWLHQHWGLRSDPQDSLKAGQTWRVAVTPALKRGHRTFPGQAGEKEGGREGGRGPASVDRVESSLGRHMCARTHGKNTPHTHMHTRAHTHIMYTCKCPQNKSAY